MTSELYEKLQSEVHVWFCQPPLIQNAEKLSACKAVLSASELARYQRFRFEKDKHSYLVSHALLRHALSKYADVPAAQWQFCRGEHGKPELPVSSATPALRFNLTHTAGFSACVISLGRCCGIDAENIQRKNKLRAVAQRMFAGEELERLDESNINARFYYFWTLREAYVKALGSGLAASSKDFYFDIDIHALSAVMHGKSRGADAGKNWRFKLYEPTLQHVLAIAVEATDEVNLVMREWLP